MTEGRCKVQWDHTAALLWLLIEVNRDPKKKGPELTDLHPYRKGERKPVPKDKIPVGSLKGLFTEGQIRWSDLPTNGAGQSSR